MNRLHPVDPAIAEGKAKTLLDGVKAGIGSVPNIFRLLAASPATLEAYLSYNRALSHGALPAKIREQIALVAAETNGCDYCASAHSLLGQHAGLSQDDINEALEGRAADPKADAALRFAKLLLEKRGRISDSDLNRVKEAGLSEAEIGEIVAHVAINVFTNYFNIAFDTEIDFPIVRTRQAKVAQDIGTKLNFARLGALMRPGRCPKTTTRNWRIMTLFKTLS
jgi:uncharacterized peroxidase-related enzyme